MNSSIRIDTWQLTPRSRGWVECHPLASPRREDVVIALIEAAAHGDLPDRPDLVCPWIADLEAFLHTRLVRDQESTVLFADAREWFRSHQSSKSRPCPGTHCLSSAIQARVLALYGLGLRHDISTPSGFKRGWATLRLLPPPPPFQSVGSASGGGGGAESPASGHGGKRPAGSPTDKNPSVPDGSDGW